MAFAQLGMLLWLFVPLGMCFACSSHRAATSHPFSL